MSCFRSDTSNSRLPVNKTISHPFLRPPNLLLPHRWNYRIEGAQKVIFSNAPERPPQVLVLYTVKNDPCEPFQPINNLPQALFRRHLSQYLLPHHPITLTPLVIKHLSHRATPHRPIHRRAFSHISPHKTFASLYPDVAFYFGPATTLVEIKPKAALLSRSKLIPPNIAFPLRKYTIPPYHVKNYLLTHGCVPQRPYFPSDLLCSDVPTVSSAISSLLTDQSRGLRVFHDGKLCDPSHHLPELIAAAHAIVVDHECAKGILAVQAADVIDNIGAEIIMRHLIRRVGQQQATKLLRRALYDVQRVSDYDEITYASPVQAQEEHNLIEYDNALKAAQELPVPIAVELLAGFLQAAAAKDCSMMIALSKANEVEETAEGIVFDVHRVRWIARLWVVDTDEKHLAKILGKWGVQDRQQSSILSNMASSASDTSTFV